MSSKITYTKSYNPSDYSVAEKERHQKFLDQYQDGKAYFDSFIKPRLDESYKLYCSYAGDRKKKIQTWQSNIFVPYVQAVIETLIPRVIDGRPDLGVWGRSEDDQLRASKVKMLLDYTWEISKFDSVLEDMVRATMIFGTSFIQVYWKKDVRELSFLSTKDINSKSPKWVKREKIFYDAPIAIWVDNYDLLYDWHNTRREDKQYWIKRLLLSEEGIKRRCPMHDKKRLEMALNSGSGDLNAWDEVRSLVKEENEMSGVNKLSGGSGSMPNNKAQSGEDAQIKMYECFEVYRPFEDEYEFRVGGGNVPILKNGYMPIPYDYKEAPFIETTYLRVPGEFEGYSLPMILKSPQLMLNTIKNQRLDAAKLNIHKMWIVNPLANIKQEDLVTRPFGIIYSPDPNGARAVEFSDIKASSYREEELLKEDMRHASGVDDASMGTSGANSATEVRHMRESTLERVRLFINHLGDSLSILERRWIDMYRQFFTESMTLRITGDDGITQYPLVEKDDLGGEFDYRATVTPSIAGMQDMEKKQGMDLFQLLINMPFIDPQKLTSRVISSWGWNVESISKEQEQMAPDQELPPEGDPNAEQLPPEEMAMEEEGALPPELEGKIDPAVYQQMLSTLNPTSGGGSSMKNLMSPNNNPMSGMMSGEGPMPPPTVQGIAGGKGGPIGNTRGLNRTGNVNTDININQNSNPESALMRSVNSLQNKK